MDLDTSFVTEEVYSSDFYRFEIQRSLSRRCFVLKIQQYDVGVSGKFHDVDEFKFDSMKELRAELYARYWILCGPYPESE